MNATMGNLLKRFKLGQALRFFGAILIIVSTLITGYLSYDNQNDQARLQDENARLRSEIDRTERSIDMADLVSSLGYIGHVVSRESANRDPILKRVGKQISRVQRRSVASLQTSKPHLPAHPSGNGASALSAQVQPDVHQVLKLRCAQPCGLPRSVEESRNQLLVTA